MQGPRYDGLPYEVGPLARLVVAYAQGHKELKNLIDGTLKAAGLPVTVSSRPSADGRPGHRDEILADHIEGWVNELIKNVKAGDTRT